MKKFWSSLLLVLAFTSYAIYRRFAWPDIVITASGNGQASSSSSANDVPPAADPSPPSVLATRTRYANGAYTSDVADAYYGNVQVKVIVRGGKIADVQFLDHPQDRGHSIRINNRAMPLLVSEAIQTQSAPVDVVSGATFTSGAFNRSLASALSQARRA